MTEDSKSMLEANDLLFFFAAHSTLGLHFHFGEKGKLQTLYVTKQLLVEGFSCEAGHLQESTLDSTVMGPSRLRVPRAVFGFNRKIKKEKRENSFSHSLVCFESEN